MRTTESLLVIEVGARVSIINGTGQQEGHRPTTESLELVQVVGARAIINNGTQGQQESNLATTTSSWAEDETPLNISH